MTNNRTVPPELNHYEAAKLTDDTLTFNDYGKKKVYNLQFPIQFNSVKEESPTVKYSRSIMVVSSATYTFEALLV